LINANEVDPEPIFISDFVCNYSCTIDECDNFKDSDTYDYDEAYDLEILFDDVDDNGDSKLYKNEIQGYLEKLGKIGPIWCRKGEIETSNTPETFYENKEECLVDQIWNVTYPPDNFNNGTD